MTKKDSLGRSTQENLKRIVQIKNSTLFFQIRKRNFSFKFLQQSHVSGGLESLTRTGSCYPDSYTRQLTLFFICYGLASHPVGSSYAPSCFMLHGNRG